ncbi:hypothetical protein GCM10023320_49800 [Pseudonocardia adelaidensis]|uniref:Uncharacterized protein n=1 Tax=Pseudonocardia adelaidensis TaxID=648754 RepID=A0ABP9NSC9_9PSEU
MDSGKPLLDLIGEVVPFRDVERAARVLPPPEPMPLRFESCDLAGELVKACGQVGALVRTE